MRKIPQLPVQHMLCKNFFAEFYNINNINRQMLNQNHRIEDLRNMLRQCICAIMIILSIVVCAQIFFGMKLIDAMNIDSPKLEETINQETAKYHCDLAESQIQQRNYAQGIIEYERCVRVYQKIIGKDDEIADILVNKIAEIYTKQGKYSAAQAAYQKGLHIYLQREGVRNYNMRYNMAGALTNLCWIQYLKGQYTKALRYCYQSLEIWDKVTGLKNVEAASTLNNIGLIYKNQKLFKQALEAFLKMISIYENTGNMMTVQAADALNNIALVKANQGNYTQVLSIFESALSIYESLKGKNCIEAATTLTNIGVIYKNMGNYIRAIQMYQRSIDIYELNRLKHRQYANNNFWLGIVYEIIEEYDRAIEAYQTALPHLPINRPAEINKRNISQHFQLFSQIRNKRSRQKRLARSPLTDHHEFNKSFKFADNVQERYDAITLEAQYLFLFSGAQYQRKGQQCIQIFVSFFCKKEIFCRTIPIDQFFRFMLNNNILIIIIFI